MGYPYLALAKKAIYVLKKEAQALEREILLTKANLNKR
jgi:hypothetical protein